MIKFFLFLRIKSLPLLIEKYASLVFDLLLLYHVAMIYTIFYLSLIHIYNAVSTASIVTAVSRHQSSTARKGYIFKGTNVIIPADKKSTVTVGVKSVSYTHLDVYKRQP